MLCLVRYLFIISTSVIDCLGRFVPEMTYYVSSGTLNLAQLKLKLTRITGRSSGWTVRRPETDILPLCLFAMSPTIRISGFSYF